MKKGVGKELVASTLETAYEDVDEVALARQYIARKRMKQPSGANAQKETVRTMNRLMRAGFSSSAIYKVLREWDLPEEVAEGMEEEGAGDSDVMLGRMRMSDGVLPDGPTARGAGVHAFRALSTVGRRELLVPTSGRTFAGDPAVTGIRVTK